MLVAAFDVETEGGHTEGDAPPGGTTVRDRPWPSDVWSWDSAPDEGDLRRLGVRRRINRQIRVWIRLYTALRIRFWIRWRTRIDRFFFVVFAGVTIGAEEGL